MDYKTILHTHKREPIFSLFYRYIKYIKDIDIDRGADTLHVILLPSEPQGHSTTVINARNFVYDIFVHWSLRNRLMGFAKLSRNNKCSIASPPVLDIEEIRLGTPIVILNLFNRKFTEPIDTSKDIKRCL